MDPYANLVDYLRAIQDVDTERMRELAGALADWLDAGGFAPDPRPAIHALFNAVAYPKE